MKIHESVVRRTGKLVAKIFFALLLLKLFIFVYRFSNPSSLSYLDAKLNIILIAILTLAVILLWPHQRTLSSLRIFLLNLEMKESEEYAKLAISYLFQISLIAYASFLIINEFREIGFNLSYMLIIVIIFGIFSVIFAPKKEKINSAGKKYYLFVIIIASFSSIMIFTKTSQMGWPAKVLSLLAGVLIIILTLMIEKSRREA